MKSSFKVPRWALTVLLLITLLGAAGNLAYEFLNVAPRAVAYWVRAGNDLFLAYMVWLARFYQASGR